MTVAAQNPPRARALPIRCAHPVAGHASLAAEIAWLETLDLAQLRVQFRNRTGRIAPARIARHVLHRVLAYRIQADAQGDLKPDTRRLLARMAVASTVRAGAVDATGGAAGTVVVAPFSAVPLHRPAPQRGTVLVREWQGTLERVSVGQGGYEWKGSTYPSLSAVATAITGTKWNGRRFFGLDRPPAKIGAGA